VAVEGIGDGVGQVVGTAAGGVELAEKRGGVAAQGLFDFGWLAQLFAAKGLM
jgi:hypothetical protein